MGHYLPPPYPRETGVLASVDEEGRELVLHETRPGVWTAYEWSSDFGVRAALKVGMTPEQWAACGQALSNGGRVAM